MPSEVAVGVEVVVFVVVIVIVPLLDGFTSLSWSERDRESSAVVLPLLPPMPSLERMPEPDLGFLDCCCLSLTPITPDAIVFVVVDVALVIVGIDEADEDDENKDEED